MPVVDSAPSHQRVRIARCLLAPLSLAAVVLGACASKGQDEKPPPEKPPRLLEGIRVAQYGMGRLFDAEVSPDGRYLALTSGRLVIVDASTYKLVHEFPNEVVAKRVAWSPDGHWLAHSVSDNESGEDVSVRAVGTWEEKLRLTREVGKVAIMTRRVKGPVYDLAYSPDSRLLAAGGQTGIINLWDIPSGKRAYRFADDLSSVFNLCFAQGGRLFSCAGKSLDLTQPSLVVRDLKTGEIAFRASCERGGLAPSGRVLFGSAPPLAPRPSGQPASYWDAVTFCADSKGHFDEGQILRGEASVVAFPPDGDGRVVAYGGDNGNVWLWTRATGTLHLSEQAGPDRPHGHISMIKAIQFLPDGRRLMTASSEGLIWFWNVTDLIEEERRR